MICSNGNMDSLLCLMALLDLVALFAVFGVLFMYFVHIVAIVYGKVKLHRCDLPSSYASNSCPGVTMLKTISELSFVNCKDYFGNGAPCNVFPECIPWSDGCNLYAPLVGEDENLYMNLKSCFNLNYKKLQILFCVQDENDPASRTVKKLMDDYPNADVQLLTCGTTGGVNPKINNMLQGYKVAKHDLVWINDSALFVDPNTLSQMVSDMTADVGIAHQLPFLMNKSSFSGVLQKVYFGTQHSRVYLFANALGFTCTNGMSMLLRKHVLDEVGGLQAFSSYIAEDFFISKSIADRGWKIALSSLPAMQNPSKIDLSSFFTRMVRWTRLRITMMPVIGVLEPLTECLAIGLLGGCGAYYLWGFNIWKLLFGHCLFWFVADQLLLHTIQGPVSMPPFYELTLAWLLRETCTYFIFLRGLCGREITWKNGAFRIQTGGKAYRIEGMKVEDDEHCL